MYCSSLRCEFTTKDPVFVVLVAYPSELSLAGTRVEDQSYKSIPTKGLQSFFQSMHTVADYLHQFVLYSPSVWCVCPPVQNEFLGPVITGDGAFRWGSACTLHSLTLKSPLALLWWSTKPCDTHAQIERLLWNNAHITWNSASLVATLKLAYSK